LDQEFHAFNQDTDLLNYKIETKFPQRSDIETPKKQKDTNEFENQKTITP
jgi:hypothetical protein